MRMTMTEPGHRNPAGEIEKFAPVGCVEVGAFAPVDGDIPPTISRHNGCYHGISPARLGWKSGWDAGLSSSPVPRRRDVPHPPRVPARYAGIAHHRLLSSPRRGRFADPYDQ